MRKFWTIVAEIVTLLVTRNNSWTSWIAIVTYNNVLLSFRSRNKLLLKYLFKRRNTELSSDYI